MISNDEGAAFGAAILISHIIAGFFANSIYRKHMEKYIKLYENVDTYKEVEYFAISLPRLVISSLLSGGLYTVYWGYKNWHNYQKTTSDDVNPYLCGWFFNWTAISLFAKIRYSVKSAKSFTIYGVACLLIFLAQIAISQALSKDLIGSDLILDMILLYLILEIIYPFCIVPVQSSVNKYTTEVLKKPLDKKFYPWEIVFLLLGFILNYGFWFGNPFTANEPDFTEEQAEKIGNSVGFIYRHTKGYAMVCEQEGYPLKEYPYRFNSVFSQEINALSTELAKKGYTLEQVENYLINEQLKTNMKQSIYDELNELRKIWIRTFISLQNNTPVEKVEWNEEFDSMMTLKDTCELFDQHGINIVLQGENKDLLKENAL